MYEFFKFGHLGATCIRIFVVLGSFHWAVSTEGVESCKETCSALNEDFICLADGFAVLDTEEKVEHAFRLAGHTCSEFKGWDYGTGFAICLNQDCCGGDCVNACARPENGRTCDAVGHGAYHRLCPCGIVTNPPTSTPTLWPTTPLPASVMRIKVASYTL